MAKFDRFFLLFWGENQHFCNSWTEFAIAGKSGLRYLKIFELVALNDLSKLDLCLEKPPLALLLVAVNFGLERGMSYNRNRSDGGCVPLSCVRTLWLDDKGRGKNILAAKNKKNAVLTGRKR